MLTDYHTHLRPDDLGATAAKYYTEENVESYLRAAEKRGVDEFGFSEHMHRFKQALGVWRHPFWDANAVDDLDSYYEFLKQMKAAGHKVKLGIEVDWIPGREDRLQELIDSYRWDYVLGSVHFLGDRAVDHPDYDIWRYKEDAGAIWNRYFDALGDAAASGLFDILAHPDLVKIWGKCPHGDLRRFYDRAMEQIAGADVAVEVSTAGLRKPVGEIYPAPELLELLIEAGKPCSLSSDAHVPEDVGSGYDLAVPLMHSAGIEEICVFDGRERKMVPL